MIVYMANEFKTLSKLQVFKQKVAPTLMPIIKSLGIIWYNIVC
jgi:hypothetical protein